MKTVIKLIANLFLICLLICLFAQVFATNNTCENASLIEITPEGMELYPSADNLTDNFAVCYNGFVFDDIFVSYYKLVIPPSGSIRFDGSLDYGVRIFDSCNGNLLFCDDSFYEYFFPFESFTDILQFNPGDTIIVQLYHEQEDYIHVSEIGTSSNNSCENPVWINLRTDGEITDVDVDHSTNTLSSKPVCNTSQKVFADSYFNLVVPPSGVLRFENPYSFGINFLDNCNGESLFCFYKEPNVSYDVVDVDNFSPGDTLLMQVFQTEPAYIENELNYTYPEIERIRFPLYITEFIAPENKDCSTAQLIDFGDIIDFKPSNYLLEIDPVCGSSAVGADAFYKFVVPSTGAVKLGRLIFTFSVNHNENYSFGGISIYQDCDEEPLFCISDERFNNGYFFDTNGNVYGDEIISDLNPNDTLIFQLFSKRYNSRYKTKLEIAQPTVNNNCEKAIPINLNITNNLANGTTLSLKENNLNLLPDCYYNPDYLNVKPSTDAYYQLTVPASGKIKFNLSTSVGIAVYNTCAGNTLFCNNETGLEQTVENLMPGSNILIQFFDFWDAPDSFTFSVTDPPVNLNCHSDDWKALKAIYENLEGDNWIKNNGWEQVTVNSAQSDCNLNLLYGVTINASGRVNCIDLDGIPNCTYDLNSPGNNLIGTLPDEIGLLSELSKLCLNYNKISGNLPASFSQLTNLQSLWLHSNQLSGEIPGDILYDLRNNLEYLYLSSNQFNGLIPNSIGQCKNLVELGLYKNNLIGNIPVNLANLKNIERISLRNNKLGGAIPSQLGDIASLKILYLSDNQLTGKIPINFSKLTNLKALMIYNNQLSGCFNENLTTLCGQLNLTNASSNIDSGNTFDAKWEDYCSCLSGSCAEQTTFQLIENTPMSNIYQYNGNIETKGTVYLGLLDSQPKSVTFSATNIILNEGFEVKNGTAFTAEYDPCQN